MENATSVGLGREKKKESFSRVIGVGTRKYLIFWIFGYHWYTALSFAEGD